jgi:hypothetical protein
MVSVFSDLALAFQPPLVKNPEPAWLAEHEGEHIAALRLFHEACWAWTSFCWQRKYIAMLQGNTRTTELASVRWGTTVAGLGNLFEYAIACRKQSLLTAFFLVTTEQLEEIADVKNLSSNQQQIVDLFLSLADRQDARHDLFGQTLPDILLAILGRIEKSPPYRHQGESAVTKRIRLHKQAYFAKLTDETLSGKPPIGQDEFNEVSTALALRALCPDIAPIAAYHILAADGSQCSLVTAIAGKWYRASQPAKAAAFVDPQWLQWVVLGEWLCGMEDRHAKNLIIDKETQRCGIIDAARSWLYRQPGFLGWNTELPGKPFCESFARALWETSDAQLHFARQLLLAACQREEAMITVLQSIAMPREIIAQLQRQFAILRAALATATGDIRLIALEHIAESW